jgi:hypothetical protein
MTKRAGISSDADPFEADPVVWGRGGWGRDQIRDGSTDRLGPPSACARGRSDEAIVAGADYRLAKIDLRLFREFSTNATDPPKAPV